MSVHCKLSLGPYSALARSTEMRVLNSIFSSLIQYPHATRYTKSFGLPVSLVTVTERGCPKSRLVFLGAAGANAELGNGLPGPSFLDQVGRRIYYCVIHTPKPTDGPVVW